MRVRAAVQNPPELGDSYEERFGTPERTLVSCWLRGLEVRKDAVTAKLAGKATQELELIERAEAGELPVLPWKGGVPKAGKQHEKVGATHYLAMWRGLRGEDLDIDLESTNVVTCTRFGVRVTFTMDSAVLGGLA